MNAKRTRRALLLLAAAVAASGALVMPLGRGPGVGRAAAASSTQPPTAGDSFEPQLGLPASGVVAFGSSTGESPGETWAYGRLGQTPTEIEGKDYSEQDVLLRRSDASPTWQAVPLPQAPEGGPVGGAGGPGAYGVLAGQATEDGGVVLLSGQSIVARDPGGAPAPLPEPQQGAPGSSAEEHGLTSGESLLPSGVVGAPTVPYAAVEEEGRRVGVLIAPYQDGGKQSSSGQPEAQPGVLHYGGGHWTREPVEATGEALSHFTALATSCSGTQAAPGASSPENCWLLAGYGVHGLERLALYRRSRLGESGWGWRPQRVSDWVFGSDSPPSGVTRVSSLPQGAQMLTSTSQGVWVDLQVDVNGQPRPVDMSELVLTPAQAGESANVAGAWCYPTGTVCSEKQSLGAALPTTYRSFAWPGASSSDPGTRVITGLPEGAMLELAGGVYSYTIGDGGEERGGAALYRNSPEAPVEGVIASGSGNRRYEGEDREGQAQAVGVTTHPAGDQLHDESVPFRHPLLALASAPGATPGDPNAEALAVGLEGQIGRYVPGEGWRAEALYNAEGKAQAATLRGVAWPEPKRAYAVGDNGTMWLWIQELGYWVPDPAKPFNFEGNLMAIAFDSSNPQLGFAVGKEGVLLEYGKSWEEIAKQRVKQEAKRLEAELKMEEWRLNFTSVAFAGNEALASYRYVAPGEGEEAGGLLVYNEEAVCLQEDEALERAGRQVLADERSCWHASASASTLLGGLPSIRDTVLSKVAGLPDGGAVAGGPDLIMERESAGSEWRLSQTPPTEVANISALAAYREPGGPVRAIASVEVDRWLNPNENGTLRRGPFGGDVPVSGGAGQPPPLIPPDPLPNSGYVLKQTAAGWVDMEHEALPVQEGERDMPLRPDPVFALLVDASGQQGLAVGGQTYDVGGDGPEGNGETAGAMRFPTASGEGLATPAAVAAPAGQASFVIGGEAACAEACYALANESIGADVWLTHALATAAQISPTPRAFLYTGHRAAGASLGAGATEAFERELIGFKGLLSAAGTLPVYVDPSSDLMPGSIGKGPFERILQPSGVARGPAGTDAYALTSTGASGGQVRLIVLDYSGAELGASQREWLQAQLCAAKGEGDPAIVMGQDALGFDLPDALGPAPSQGPDAEAVSQLLVHSECHGSAAPYAAASAYVFDYPGVNVHAAVAYRGASIPAYGSGTLGPQTAAAATVNRNSLVSSGYLLLNVNTSLTAREPDNTAPVSAQVIPNAGELSIEATEGTLLRRSHIALFEALARRPPAGVQIGGGGGGEGRLIFPSAYDPIPHDCRGPNCAYEVPIEYTFTSSKPDVGGFVLHEAASESRLQIQLSSKGQPVPDEPRNAKGELNPGDRFAENGKGEAVNERGETLPPNRSALFCAYNEGTTTVSITTGGLTYSMPVTVQGGSSEQPCGTVPLQNPPPRYEPASTPFVLPNASTPGVAPVNPQISTLPPPPPPLKAPHPPSPHPHPPALLPSQPGLLFPLPRIVPPPAPNLPRPTPPSGTAQVPSQSPVSQQVTVAEREEEEQSAIQHVHNMAAYDRHGEGESMPTWPLALVVIAAAAAAGLRPRRDRESPVYAWARAHRKDGRHR